MAHKVFIDCNTKVIVIDGKPYLEKRFGQKDTENIF